jgi:zinc D-Ala-D-Ala carboxypeptidase
MNLSAHFTVAELTASNKAAQLGIDNTPPPELVPRLVLCAEMLERIRSTLGVPIIVTSAYRCRPLNTAVGGVTSSDHTQGHAADFVAPGYGSAYDIAKLIAPLVSVLGVGQLIYENTKTASWVHVSTHTPEKLSNRVITITDAGAQLGIQVLA